MSGELTAVREVWAQRSQARTRTDVLYLVYVSVLTVLVLGAPALRMAGSFLARPDVLPALTHPAAASVVGVLVLVAAAAMVQLGAVRGPALLAPFLTSTLAASGIRRRTVLWRPFVRALLVPVLGMAVVAALISATLVSADAAGGSSAAWFVLAAIGAGLLLGAAWASGQLLRPGPRRLLMAVLLLGAVASAALPSAPGLGGAYPLSSGSTGLWALLLLGAGVLSAVAGVGLLDRLRGQVLREQSQRWESVTTIATSGDLAAAAGALRTPPSAGRRLPAVGSRPLVLLYARRDTVSWLRSPERVAGGVVVALLAAALLALSAQLTGPLSWAAVLLGALALWGAGGTLVDGIRHGVHTLGAPGLFGQTAAVQVLLHAVAPSLLLTALAAAGGATGLLAGGDLIAGSGLATGGGAVLADGLELRSGRDAVAVLLPVLLAPVVIAGRVHDAAKGPMPLRLMTPMPTPQGDGAVLAMLAWQSDALLLVVLSGALLAGLGLLGLGWLLGGTALLLAVLALMTRRRLRALGL